MDQFEKLKPGEAVCCVCLRPSFSLLDGSGARWIGIASSVEGFRPTRRFPPGGLRDGQRGDGTAMADRFGRGCVVTPCRGTRPDDTCQVEAEGALLVRARRSHPPRHPPGPGGGAGRGPPPPRDSHFAPFRPEAEDHLRSFALTPDEKKQMEDDYKLALAMQRDEAAAMNGRGEEEKYDRFHLVGRSCGSSNVMDKTGVGREMCADDSILSRICTSE